MNKGGSWQRRRTDSSRSPLEENKWEATHDDSSTIRRRETAGSQGIIYYYELKPFTAWLITVLLYASCDN